MWIEQRNGTYRMYERYTDPVTDRVHKVSVRFDKDTPQQRNKAKAKLDELIDSRRKFVYNLSFSSLVDFYLYAKSKETKASTQRRNEHEGNTLKKILGDATAEDLTAGYVKAKFLKYSSKPTTVNEHIQRFKEIIRWGYQNDFVEDASYLDKLTKMKDKSRRQKVKDKFLEREECQMLLDEMSGTHYYVTKFMILSGTRVGETLALKEEDLDFDAREISITKTKDLETGELTSPKTPTSVRKIYMQDDLLELCKEIVDYKKTLKNVEGDFLFYDAYAEPMNYAAYRKQLGISSEKALGRKIGAHTLRHTHASILAENNIDFEQIQRRLGHENSRITREIYIHVTKRQIEKDNEAIKELKIV